MNSRALKMLMDEHEIILKAVQHARTLLKIGAGSGNKDSLAWHIAFFKEYGDRFHHGKEEAVLFPELAERNEMLGMTIVESLKEHHDNFRVTLADISLCLEEGNWELVKKDFERYLSDLEDHISAENDELFVSAEALWSNEESETMYFRFQDMDRELGEERKRDFENRVLK